MAEYIEREAARALIKNFGKGAISDGRMELDTVDDIILLASAVECLPAADVAPVVHGKWIAEENESISKRNRLIKYKKYSCSICGRSNGRRMGKHCPNCGAKMDGEEQGDE